MNSQPELDIVLDRLRAYRRAAKLSYSALALRAKLSRAALMGMDEKDWGPTSTTIWAIEALIPSGWQIDQPLPEQPARRPRRSAAEPKRSAA